MDFLTICAFDRVSITNTPCPVQHYFASQSPRLLNLTSEARCSTLNVAAVGLPRTPGSCLRRRWPARCLRSPIYGRDPVEEPPVMADHNGAASELEQCLLERSRVSTSRSLVGSSSSSTLPPSLSSFAR